MAEGRLHFALVAPERELFNGEVERVDAPGVEGSFGVLAGHAPFMTALREGRIHVHAGGARHVFEVKGGFADVTPEGLTVLAEEVHEIPFTAEGDKRTPAAEFATAEATG